MDKDLNEYLKIRWIKSNHRKYHHLFDKWIINITQNQIYYFNKDMLKSMKKAF